MLITDNLHLETTNAFDMYEQFLDHAKKITNHEQHGNLLTY